MALLLVFALPATAQVTDGEYGDSPDGIIAGYAAPYDAVIGNFPTNFNTSNSRYSLNGGHALSVTDTWLGQVVSLERGAADPLDPDLVENFVDDDFDDGLVGGVCPSSSGSIFSTYLTFDVTFAASATGTRYINVLLDADVDGTWDSTSTTEWVVQDYPVAVNPGNTVQVTVGPFPFPSLPVATWMRVAVTSQTIGSVVSLNASGWDGSGQFTLGEFEDYLVGNQLEFVVEAAAAAEVAQAHADAIAIAWADAQARETAIALECSAASDSAFDIDVEWQSADAFAIAAAAEYSSALSFEISVANACANAQAQANAVASACASCGCATACASSSASAQASANACAQAVAAAAAFAQASAQAVGAAQASADAIAIALASANANASACALAYADAQAAASALGVAWATADAEASAAASAVSAAIAAACGGDAVAAAAAVADAQAAANASAQAAAGAFADAEASASAFAYADTYADANADALAVAVTQVSASAAAFASAQATTAVATATSASAQATATSLAQASASASAYCSSNCSCCETTGHVLTRASLAITALSAKHGAAYKPPAGTGAFKDVPKTHWAGGWIEAAVREGLMNGCGNSSFCPDDPVLRSELPEVGLKALNGANYKPIGALGMFSDLPPSDPRSDWVEDAYSQGAVEGCGSGKYCPSQLATRADSLRAVDALFKLDRACPVDTTPTEP
ncbi:MAG: S-layer homology domain-containing protein [Acidobacteriota bacterium]|nr:S-layer homology domain-containing protein [Acidobacteriota bacterium]